MKIKAEEIDSLFATPIQDIVLDEENGLLKFNFERDKSKKLYHDFFYYINGVTYE